MAEELIRVVPFWDVESTPVKSGRSPNYTIQAILDTLNQAGAIVTKIYCIVASESPSRINAQTLAAIQAHPRCVLHSIFPADFEDENIPSQAVDDVIRQMVDVLTPSHCSHICLIGSYGRGFLNYVIRWRNRGFKVLLLCKTRSWKPYIFSLDQCACFAGIYRRNDLDWPIPEHQDPNALGAFQTAPNNNITAVWWDMNTCPLPKSYDPHCVRSTIESALKRSIGSGPVVIFAMGNMHYFNADVIKDIASSGISIRHSFRMEHILYDMMSWKKCNPPPGNIMVISNAPDANRLTLFLSNQNYDVIHGPEFLWDALMNSRPGIPTTGTNCRDWLCSLCNESSPTFEDFYTHLSSSTTHVCNVRATSYPTLF